MKHTKSGKSDIIINTLNPYEHGMQRYLSLSKDIERLVDNAEDNNDACIPIELFAEFMTLQEELYQKAAKKKREETN